MAEAFEGADIVIPKSWAPFAAMEKRTNLYAEGDDTGIAALEKELLAQNATHQDWCSTTELMENTANGQDTIFMHPLPSFCIVGVRDKRFRCGCPVARVMGTMASGEVLP